MAAEKKLSRKEKVLKYLMKSQLEEVSNDDLIKGTGIDRSNMSKILKPLEEKGVISRRYEQEGRSKLVYIKLISEDFFDLTNSQSDNSTNSLEDDNSNLVLDDKKEEKESIQKIKTNSQPNNLTNSHILAADSQLYPTFDPNEMLLKVKEYAIKNTVAWGSIGKSFGDGSHNGVFQRRKIIDTVFIVSEIIRREGLL